MRNHANSASTGLMFGLLALAAACASDAKDDRVVNFRYIGGGKALGSVLQHEGNGGTVNFAETVVYEIEASGRAKRQFTVPGTVTQWVRVR